MCIRDRYIISYLKEVHIPVDFALSAAYPNPFNPSTTIGFALPNDIKVILEVYNLKGQLVHTLTDGIMDAGYHHVVWDAHQMASGMYFIKMTAGDYIDTQKIMLLK